jgi:toxin-antitoxin system PIN domain toxin
MHPWRPVDACGVVREWLGRPYVSQVHPGDRHAEILFDLLADVGAAGHLTTDAHLAALAIEHQAELHSTDTDFARFSGLRWVNPLD